MINTIIKNILPYGISNYIIKNKAIYKSITNNYTKEEPPVFNETGEKFKSLFLNDTRISNWPYSFVSNRYPKHIMWDRHNYGLKNHLYSHEKISETFGNPIKKFAFILEGETTDKKTYSYYKKNKELIKEFDLLFTHSEELLNKYSNAVFIPSGGVYYGTLEHGGNIYNEQYKNKSKNISIVSSNKTMCELHKLRLNLANYFKNSAKVDTYGNFDGGEYIKISQSLSDYRYSFAIENDITPFRFTEKLLNCFAAMTIPIYIGATKIEKFFNPNGIVQVSNFDFNEIDKIVNNCNKIDYESRVPAIIDNFNRVQNYLCIEDYIWKNYKDNFI